MMAVADLYIVAGSKVSTGAPVVMTSPDAATWTEVPSWPGGNADYVHIANDTYIVSTASALTPNNYAHSDDGASWNLNDTPPAVLSAVWAGDRYVFLGATNAYTSPTLDSSWNGPYPKGSTNEPRRLLFHDGVLVGVGRGGGAGQPPVWYSTDLGATWSTYMPTNNVGVWDVTRGPDRFIAVRPRFGGASDAVLSSTAGTSWSLLSTGLTDHAWYNVCYGNGRYVAVGIDNPGNIKVMTSTDGVSWTGHTPTGLATLTAGVLSGSSRMAFGLGRFLLVNPLIGSVFVSTDGTAWTEQTFADRDFRGCAAGRAIPRGGPYLGLRR